MIGWIFLLLYSMNSTAGVLETLSQGSYYLASLEGCKASDPELVKLALDQAENTCQTNTLSLRQQTSQLAQIAKQPTPDQESRFFALLALQHSQELQCSADFSAQVASHDSQSAKEIAKTFLQLHQQKQKLIEASRRIAENPMALNKVCPIDKKDLQAEDADCQNVFNARLSYQLALANVPLAGLPEIKKLLEEVANIKIPPADLETRVRQVYASAQGFLKAEASELQAKAQSKGGEGFDRNARHALLSDPRVVKKIIEDGGNSPDLQSLACRANARFGKGADDLQTGLFVGSFLLGTGASVATKAGSAAWKISNGINAARASGFLTLNSTRILQIGALASNAGLSAVDIVKACGTKPVARVQASCVSSPSVHELEQDSCLMAASIAALQAGGFAAAAIAEVRTSQKIATAVEEAGVAQKVALATPQKGIQSVPSVRELPLPKSFQKDLLENANVKKLRETYGTGKDLAFEIKPNPDPEFNNPSYRESGEGIQALFLKRSLQTIFPDAEITGSGQASQRPKRIRLNIDDTHEHTREVSRKEKKLIFEMSKLKMANPGVGELDKQTMRTRLGIPKDARIVSLNNSLYNNSNDIYHLIHQIHLAKPQPHFIIVSMGNIERLALIEEVFLRHPKIRTKFEIKRLSQLNGDPLKLGSPVVIMNDTMGKMHAVYSVSDVNVTAGAVNLAEPLLARTPTVFYDYTSVYMKGYNEAVFATMGEQARLSGATSIDDVDSLALKLRPYLSHPQSLDGPPPYSVATENSKSPLDAFTEEIKNKMDNQLKATQP